MLRGAPSLALTLLLLVPLPGQAAQSPEFPSFDTTAETTHRQITWEDFKGRAPRRSRSASNVGWAHIGTQIRIAGMDTERRRISDSLWHCTTPSSQPYAVMDKLQSHVDPKARNKTLLGHEQLHFDLAEALARDLRVQLLAIVGEGDTATTAQFDFERQAQNAHRETMREHGALQNLYDQETKHGTVKRKQKSWQSRIKTMLRQATEALQAVTEQAASSEETGSAEKTGSGDPGDATP